MQTISRGWSFLTQAWRMAFSDKDLIKPSVYALFVGFLVSILGAVTTILAVLNLGSSNTTAQIILVILALVFVFASYIISYVFSAMTVYLIYGYLAEGDGRMDKAWAIVRRDLFDLITLAAASTVANAFKRSVKGKGRSQARNFMANTLETLWTEFAFLILPAMVIENLNLKDGIKRAAQIARDNLLLVGVSTVGVKVVTGLIGFLLGLVGAALGVGAGYGLVSLLGEGILGIVAAIGLGVPIFFIFILAAIIINTYTGTAYHTCLYLWARDVERARQTGKAALKVAAPAPLAAVLK